MNLGELIQYLEAAKDILANDDAEVLYVTSGVEGPPRYVAFNTCTVYRENNWVVLAIEGPVVETFNRPIEKGNSHDLC